METAHTPQSPALDKQEAISITYDRAFDDVPAIVWRGLVFVWAIFCTIMWLAFGRESEAAFALVVVSLFAAMYFMLPYLLASFSPAREKKATLKDEVKTLNGPLSGKEAAVQILMIPVTVTLALGLSVLVGMFVL